MRKSRAVGLVLLATATLAQQQQTVEITSEPSHHRVFENEYVRVFNVRVAPKASTLVHRHNYDYLFVTLGDSDVVSVRPAEKPVALQLKDGEVRFTPGHFAHAAINNADRLFHNITIELLKPSTNVRTCTEPCPFEPPDETGPRRQQRIRASEWTVWSFTLPPSPAPLSSTPFYRSTGSSSPALFIAVSALDLSGSVPGAPKRLTSGDTVWMPPNTGYAVRRNNGAEARYVLLEFNQEPSKP
ncbi:MAG TPA: hypothetical protein VFR84_16395 [Candidatus Angelobacter sp.]|nr:hypothetical protein [Candidatus Angelobacter sp.]